MKSCSRDWRRVVPMIAGVIYCSVISACYDVFDVDRAQEWTDALSGGAPPIQTLGCTANGTTRRRRHNGRPRCSRGRQSKQRRRGTLPGRRALSPSRRSRACGGIVPSRQPVRRKPYPGLALLRLAQGNVEAAGAAARRMLEETRDARSRARLLGAAVENHARAARCRIGSRCGRRAFANRPHVRITCPARGSGASVWCGQPRSWRIRRRVGVATERVDSLAGDAWAA